MMADLDSRPNPPSVGEMVQLIRRDRAKRLPMTDLTPQQLTALEASAPDEETRMLAAVLATMTPGQRALLRFKAR